MIFQNINQFEKAKKTLIESEGDINYAFQHLKEDKSFSNMSESELIDSLTELNEGLGEKILNFLGSKLGGDVSKIKDVLSKMKEQELKFNQEEFEIWNEFYSLLADQKALDKDRRNPNYSDLNRELSQSRNALNLRLKELTKAHDDIFSSLEEKIKGLVKDSDRKKRFFNAQRADDVLETRNDRYEKIKAITSKSATRSRELEDFFGIDPEQARKDAEVAKQEAEKAIKNVKTTAPIKSPVTYTEEPEKTLNSRLEFIINSPGKFPSKRKDLERLKDDIIDIYGSVDFKTYTHEKALAIKKIEKESEAYYDQLEREYKKVV